MTRGFHDSNDSMNRRRLLGWASGAGVTALAGCPAVPDDADSDTRSDSSGAGEDADSDRPDSDLAESVPTSADVPVSAGDFDRAVNAVEAGANPEAEEPIDDLLNEFAWGDEEVLLVFPDGRYRVGGVSLSGPGRFGMVAESDADPTLVPAGPSDEIGPALLQFLDVEDFLFEGFTLDFRREGFGGKVHVTTGGDLAIRNLRVRGQYPADASGFHLAVESSSGTGLVENVSVPGGGPQGGRSIGTFVDRRHAGELTLRNCVLQNFPNNGLYASAPGGDGSLKGYGGVVRVVGGLYRNNNIANVRLGGQGAVARNVTIVVDRVPPYNRLNARGLLFRNGTGHRVENCRIVLGEEAGESLGAIVFNPDAGRVFVRNTDIEMDRDGIPAVYAPPPSAKASGEVGPVFDNVAIRGTAGGGPTVDVAGRDRTRVRNSRIVQSGADRAGLRLARSDESLLARTTIDVTGDPILSPESSLSRQRVEVVG
ncbi:hypothetical protein [Halorussus lipolyticus]|uniref:hypothetical protein n=1 Tax=Halorussus lipolyticus TaxID=3034024 RepID=UPI0023E80442|nr:hypothetical protein [Halorussus sp. DT80]